MNRKNAVGLTKDLYEYLDTNVIDNCMSKFNDFMCTERGGWMLVDAELGIIRSRFKYYS